MASSPDQPSTEQSGAERTASFEVYCAGNLSIEVDRERVTRAGIEIELPALSFRTLIALVKAAPAYVSVRALMDEVWPGQIVAPETVSQRIKLLRSALGDDGREQRYIKGVRGRGYRMATPVERLRSAVSPPARLTAGGKRSRPLGAHSQSRRIGWRTAGVALLATIAALAIALTIAPRFESGPRPATTPSPARAHVAVSESPRSARAFPPEQVRLRLARSERGTLAPTTSICRVCWHEPISVGTSDERR